MSQTNGADGAASVQTGANAPTSAGTESTADVTQLATSLAQSMPDVQEHAVQQSLSQAAQAASAQADGAGVPFDPAIHVTGADGKGVTTVRGTWALKRGRKATNAGNAQSVTKSTLGGPAAVTPQQMTQQAQQAATDAKSRAAGVAAAELLFAVGQMIGGEEWSPMQNKALGLDERPVMHSAFGDYFVATGTTDIPPGAALTFCIIAYIAPRFAMPKTQTRFGKIKGAIAQWWVNRKLRKAGLEMQVTAKPTEGAAK